jgi:hypothetical protein
MDLGRAIVRVLARDRVRAMVLGRTVPTIVGEDADIGILILDRAGLDPSQIAAVVAKFKTDANGPRVRVVFAESLPQDELDSTVSGALAEVRRRRGRDTST